ncbi:hypothetical protein [Planctomyces sp. SH-PL14]|uniref:hypothetical protein n=1 Tax=Planctomyces sp. SH-PL14 TaxID=1632864 RepID=UPI00078D07D8|nr:hypothetical protein [Planctomyces sp. SH-PL14]AMV18074.1 hypothetical protein VT03_09305 [Planctomyces sp. SH-PL14]
MAIPKWEHCLQTIRRDSIRMMAAGLAIGISGLLVYGLTSDPPITVQKSDTTNSSGQAMRQIVCELDADLDREARRNPKPLAGAPRLIPRPTPEIVPAVAFTDTAETGVDQSIQRVAATAEADRDPAPRRATSPVRLTGTIEEID